MDEEEREASDLEEEVEGLLSDDGSDVSEGDIEAGSAPKRRKLEVPVGFENSVEAEATLLDIEVSSCTTAPA
jgi:hypothetical protein